MWLQVNWTLGGDYNSDDRTYAYGQASSGTNGGQLERWQFYDRLFDHNLTATGTHQFNRNVRGGLTVGQNLNETYFRQVDIFAQTWLAPAPFKLQNTTTRTLPNDAEQRRRVEGYFAQANVDLYDQLYLQARIRNDANSAFSRGHQRAWYPGGSAAWSFAKAVHLPENIVSFGKVRLAYGESGQQPPLYTTQNVYTAVAIADFNPGSLQVPTLNGVGGLYASAIRGNPDIAPERDVIDEEIAEARWKCVLARGPLHEPQGDVHPEVHQRGRAHQQGLGADRQRAGAPALRPLHRGRWQLGAQPERGHEPRRDSGTDRRRLPDADARELRSRGQGAAVPDRDRQLLCGADHACADRIPARRVARHRLRAVRYQRQLDLVRRHHV